MGRVLVVQGAGMDLRGKTQGEIFGPETLVEINAQIKAHGVRLGMEIDVFQSNDEEQVIALLQDAKSRPYLALLINPGGFTATTGTLPAVIGDLPFPAFEVHASNPASRGVRSVITPVCRGAVCGFGYDGYGLVLDALAARLSETGDGAEERT